MNDRSTVCLRALACNDAEEAKFGRWLANKKVTTTELLCHCGQRTAQAAAGLHVLAIQDTTELNYSAHNRRTHGLGRLDERQNAGFYLHPVLALEATTGACLGIVDADIIVRGRDATPQHQSLPIEDKESYRWLRMAESSKQTLRSAKTVTMVADRESDIYEEWCRLPVEGSFHLLTRACRDRTLATGGHLFEFSDKLPVRHMYWLELPARPGKRSARPAWMELRFSPVTIKRPKNCSDRTAPAEITLNLVDVREVPGSALPGEQPVHWRLLTTHAIETIEQALTLVTWYRWRWQIEDLFRTLKRQGLDIESSQLETVEALIKLAILALQAAARSLQLVIARDGTIDRPATDAFDQNEITVIEALQPKLEGRTEKQKNPHPVKSIAWAAWTIARLGGWKGTKSEGPPGVITMIRGVARFNAICLGWHLAASGH